MDYKNKKFTLDNGKVYVVVEQVVYENNIYLLIANREDEKDCEYVEIKDDELLDIDQGLFEEKILPLFLEKFI